MKMFKEKIRDLTYGALYGLSCGNFEDLEEDEQEDVLNHVLPGVDEVLGAAISLSGLYESTKEVKYLEQKMFLIDLLVDVTGLDRDMIVDRMYELKEG